MLHNIGLLLIIHIQIWLSVQPYFAFIQNVPLHILYIFITGYIVDIIEPYVFKDVLLKCCCFSPAIDTCLGRIDVLVHCERVKPILDLVHKIISTDWTVSDCLLPLTSRIYMLLQRWRAHVNMKTKQWTVHYQWNWWCVIRVIGWPLLLTLR